VTFTKCYRNFVETGTKNATQAFVLGGFKTKDERNRRGVRCAR
jgi:hypothetical protein